MEEDLGPQARVSAGREQRFATCTEQRCACSVVPAEQIAWARGVRIASGIRVFRAMGHDSMII